MISSLTPEQEQRLVVVREEWRAIGLATGPVNREHVEPVLNQMYESIGLPSVPLVTLPSPAAVLLAIPVMALVLSGEQKGQKKPRGKKPEGPFWKKPEDWLPVQKLWSDLRSQVKERLKIQIGQLFGNGPWNEIGDHLQDQLNSQFVSDCAGWGHCEAYWIAFYRFCEEIGCVYGKKEQEQLGWWDELARHCGWWWPYGKVVLASDRPVVTKWNTAHQLHAEDGPAIEFSDGYALWALNGVRVPQELVMTAPHDLDLGRWILKERNAEVRREVVRKIGIERVCERLGAKVLDRQDDMYELLLLDLGDQRRRPYLKMRNPSIGVFHIEGVHPDCRTVEAALKWRNGRPDPPEVLT